VAAMTYFILSVLKMPVLGLVVGELLPYFNCNSSLLMTPVLDFLVGEWLVCLTAFKAC
jgi:hypothetical protein